MQTDSGGGGIPRRDFLKSAAAAGGVTAALAAGLASAASGAADAAPRRKAKTVAIFGAGPAGLTAAHELAERGFAVTVYEARDVFGGKTRSIYTDEGLPGEHGFRTTFGFYHNLPNTMRRIPYKRNPNGVWDNLVRLNAAMIAGHDRANLTIPLPFPLPFSQPPMTPQAFIDSCVAVFQTLWRLPLYEAVFAAERLAVYVSSCDRRKLEQWEFISWTDFAELKHSSREYNRFLGDGFIKSLVATKSSNCSTHSIGLVGEEYVWSLLNLNNDADNRGNDRVLNGPTSEVWITPWVHYLKSIGVKFHSSAPLAGFDVDGHHIRSASVGSASGTQKVTADYYLSAVPLERIGAMLTPQMLRADPKLRGIKKLQSAWMVGLQYFLTERRDIVDGHVSYVDSPWGLTSISQQQTWNRPVSGYGRGQARDVLSAIISDWDTPGMFNRKPARKCTEKEIVRETWRQLKAHLDGKNGVRLPDSLIHSWNLDTALTGAGTAGVAYDDPIFIQNPGSWYDRPKSWGAIDNLFLAGDWIQTQMNVACMEGANEGGRLAANSILHVSGKAGSPATIVPRFRSLIWEPLKLADEALFNAGQPNAFDVIDRRYPRRR